MLEAAVREAADPDRAAVVVDRLRHRDAGVASRAAAEPVLARAVVCLADASQSLTEAVLGDPSLLEVVDDLGERDADELTAELVALVETAAAEDGAGHRPTGTAGTALRRWKRRELLRIALADLLGRADLSAVARSLAAVADASLRAALALASPAAPLAVVGMGKLGGRELNYASDVDVIFVHEGDEADAARAARRLIALMSEATAAGIVFRTDADLRPDGRAGPLSRTVNAYRDYYTGRALNWERQALIKSRFVAGDVALAGRLFEAVLPALWESPLPPDAVRDIRVLKARSEDHMQREGLLEREVKRGRGGIRDVELAVQLLQFVHGRHDPAIRSGTTLEALGQLARHGYVDGADAEHLATAYRYLRTVEHRLQLHQEQQVYALPSDPAALTRLARVLGYRDSGKASALEQFEETHRRHQASVRAIHERLFFRPLLEALAGSRPLSAEQVADQLSALGFRDLVATRSAVEELTMGMSRTAIQLRLLFPALLQWLSEAPNPDLGLLQLRIVLDGPVRAGTVVPALRESPLAAERLCRVLGSSKVAGQGLRRHPELVADLGSEEALAQGKSREDLRREAAETLGWRGDARTGREEGLRRFKRREETRVACRDLLGFATPADVAGELTALADAALGAELDSLDRTFPFTVVAMGKLGGGELAYPSDLDVMFVHDGPQHEAEALASVVLRELGGATPEGRAWEIDARLRPEGNQGVLSRSVPSYEEYYSTYGKVWERQALIKARACAGDEDLGRRFEELRDRVTYARPPSSDELAELRHIKRRVERERLRPGENPATHLKLGPGGLVDVEFTVQLLQLQVGPDDPSVRTPSTVAGLRALVHAGSLADEEADTLEQAYRWCERVRNAWFLRTGTKRDTLPAGEDELRDLGRILGVDDVPGEHRRRATAAREVVEERFFAGG